MDYGYRKGGHKNVVQILKSVGIDVKAQQELQDNILQAVECLWV